MEDDTTPSNDETPAQPPEPPLFRAPLQPVALPQHKSHKKLWLSLMIIILLAGAGFAAWKIFGSNQSSPTASTVAPPPTTSNNSAGSNTSVNHDVPDVTTTKTYNNGFLGMTLTHPDSWTVTEDTDGAGFRVESPAFSYQTLDKGTVNGYFRIYMRKGARSQDSKYIGRGVAIEPSTTLTSTKPAPGQRTTTNLTLFGLDTTDNFAFFMIAGNFNLKTGETLGPNYGKEPETYIISGGYSSKELKDDLQTNMVAPSYIKTSNAYKQAIDILESLQLS